MIQTMGFEHSFSTSLQHYNSIVKSICVKKTLSLVFENLFRYVFLSIRFSTVIQTFLLR